MLFYLNPDFGHIAVQIIVSVWNMIFPLARVSIKTPPIFSVRFPVRLGRLAQQICPRSHIRQGTGSAGLPAVGGNVASEIAVDPPAADRRHMAILATDALFRIRAV